MPRVTWVITVVDQNVNWRKATAASLLSQIGTSPSVAARYAEIRRTMSPAGLKRKARATRN